MNKLIIAFFTTLGCSVAVQAVAPTRYVQISTNSLTQQTGAINISSMSVVRATVTTSLSLNNKQLVNVATGTLSSDGVNFGQIKYYGVVCTASVAVSSSTPSSTFVPTNLSCSGAATNGSHHVLILASGNLGTSTMSVTGTAALFRDASNLDNATFGQCAHTFTVPSLSYAQTNCTLIGYTTPGDTSSHTYSVYFMAQGAPPGSAFWGNSSTTRIIVLEVD